MNENKEQLFSHYFLCNFNDAVTEADLPEPCLQALWFGKIDNAQSAQRVYNWLTCDKSQLYDAQTAKQLLSDAVQILLTFVQQNFTGPFEQTQSCTAALKQLDLTAYEPFEQLKASGEEVNPNVVNGELLVVAREMLATLAVPYPNETALRWWQLRLICIHQHVLDDLADELYQQFERIAAQLFKQIDAFENKELQGLLLLELANGYLQFHRTDIAANTLDQLCEKLQVALKVEGLLGVRTKFQQKPLPQLCLKVTQATTAEPLPNANHTNSGVVLPKLLLLDDDTRLERIRFVEAQDNEVMTLPSILQALVLAKVRQLKRSQPKDRLADEELEPYTQTLLYQTHGPLQVRQCALLLNCLQESGMRRTVERSWKQCEECVKLLSNTTQFTLQERLSYSFASFLQPKWQVQLQLCDLLRSLGMTKSALDIYLQIHAWEQVIECYTSLELRHKAAEIIRQELAKKPTALLYCLLGDALDEPIYYAEAWAHSKGTSSKAQAYWGNYHYRRREYKEALEHLEISLDINTLQEKMLLRYGYCAIQLELWSKAIQAYITYTHLEPNGFESWNNLAQAFIKLGDKQRAHKVLGESLKCNYVNWKVWENYMLVSIDTGHLDEAMRAYERVSELNERYFDLEVLTLIIHCVAQAMLQSKEESSLLQKRAIALMGQQCIKHGNEPFVWDLAALMARTPLKKAEKLVKSYHALTRKDSQWFTKPETVEKALQLCIDVSNFSLEAIENHASDESEVMITSQLNSARLSASACLSALKRATDVPAREEQVKLLNDLLPLMLETVQKRMA